MTLKSRTFTAIRFTAASSIVTAFLKLAQVAVLVRLLEPKDYGLMAIVVVVLSFAGLFVDLGLNSAYLQRRSVTAEQRSSLFWANVGMSVVIAVLLVSISPMLANYFEDARLEPLLVLSALTFIFSSFGQQLHATAQKKMDFRPLVVLEISSTVFGFIVSVVMALLGFGVYALVWGAIANTLANTVLAWALISRGWRPMWHFRIGDIRPYIGFGGSLVGNAIVSQVNSAIDLILGGRMLAASQLGFYSVPRSFVLQLQFLVNPIITRVGFPLIAEVQHDIPRVREIYHKTLRMTASINAPLYVGIAFFAPEIVQIYLGPKWVESGHLLRVLAVWGFVRSTGNPVGSLLLGMGRAALSLKWNLILLCILPPALWFGSTYGTIGLAWTLLGFQCLAFVPAWYFLVRPVCHSKFGEIAAATLAPLLIAILAITPAYLLAVEVDGAILKLVLVVLISVPLYLVFSSKYNRDWFSAMLELAGRRR